MHVMTAVIADSIDLSEEGNQPSELVDSSEPKKHLLKLSMWETLQLSLNSTARHYFKYKTSILRVIL